MGKGEGSVFFLNLKPTNQFIAKGMDDDTTTSRHSTNGTQCQKNKKPKTIKNRYRFTS
jgi:hypothetical protein